MGLGNSYCRAGYFGDVGMVGEMGGMVRSRVGREVRVWVG